MRADAIIAAEVNRAGTEFAFHDAETFFNFPALSIEFQDMLCIVFQVSADGIIAIEGLFFGDAFSIYAVDVFISNFTLWRDALFCNEPFIVILIALLIFCGFFSTVLMARSIWA